MPARPPRAPDDSTPLAPVPTGTAVSPRRRARRSQPQQARRSSATAAFNWRITTPCVVHTRPPKSQPSDGCSGTGPDVAGTHSSPIIRPMSATPEPAPRSGPLGQSTVVSDLGSAPSLPGKRLKRRSPSQAAASSPEGPARWRAGRDRILPARVTWWGGRGRQWVQPTVACAPREQRHLLSPRGAPSWAEAVARWRRRGRRGSSAVPRNRRRCPSARVCSQLFADATSSGRLASKPTVPRAAPVFLTWRAAGRVLQPQQQSGSPQGAMRLRSALCRGRDPNCAVPGRAGGGESARGTRFSRLCTPSPTAPASPVCRRQVPRWIAAAFGLRRDGAWRAAQAMSGWAEAPTASSRVSNTGKLCCSRVPANNRRTFAGGAPARPSRHCRGRGCGHRSAPPARSSRRNSPCSC
jgi:hypothetical protein